jgi:hypothetical protein
MAKATEETSTNTTNPDAEIFEMGDRLVELDRQCFEFDSTSVRLRRLGRHSEANEAGSRMDEAAHALYDLEWSSSTRRPRPPKGIGRKFEF